VEVSGVPGWAARLLSALLEGVERRLREQESSRMVIGGDSTSRGSSGPSSYSSSDSRSWSAMGKLVTGDRPDSATNDPNHPGHSAYVMYLNYTSARR
jgi:hypothetical protein